VVICNNCCDTKKLCTFWHCVHVWCQVTILDGDYFPRQHWPTDYHNGDIVCPLWGMKLIFMCNLRNVRLERWNKFKWNISISSKWYIVQNICMIWSSNLSLTPTTFTKIFSGWRPPQAFQINQHLRHRRRLHYQGSDQNCLLLARYDFTEFIRRESFKTYIHNLCLDRLPIRRAFNAKERTDVSKLCKYSVIYIPSIDLYLQCIVVETNEGKFVEKDFTNVVYTSRFNFPLLLYS
jgi:hypothetical protein